RPHRRRSRHRSLARSTRSRPRTRSWRGSHAGSTAGSRARPRGRTGRASWCRARSAGSRSRWSRDARRRAPSRMCPPSEGHLRDHAVEPGAVLRRQIAQVVAVAGDDHLDEGVPFLLGELGEIGPAEAVEIGAAGLAALYHGRDLIGCRIDHARLPVADVLANPAAEIPAGRVAARVGESKARVEPTPATGFPVADGAEAGTDVRHGANL